MFVNQDGTVYFACMDCMDDCFDCELADRVNDDRLCPEDRALDEILGSNVPFPSMTEEERALYDAECERKYAEVEAEYEAQVNVYW